MLRALAAAVNARAGRRVYVWAGLLAVLALVLDFAPLFDVLGYDFAFALGLVAALAVGGCRTRRRLRARPARLPRTSAPSRSAGTSSRRWSFALGLLAPPLLLSLGNGVRVRDCSLGAGLAFYLLLPVGTALFAAPAGVLAATFAPRRGRLVAWALPVLSLLWSLWRLYEGPAVFAFDPFGGFFPGPIYDEALRPSSRLLQFRLVNLVWIGAAVSVALAAVGRGRDPRRWRRGALLVAGPLVVASAVLFASRGELGFAIRRGDLLAALDRTLRTEHFVVHFSSAAGKTPADVALEAEDFEFRYHQLVVTLGAEPTGVVTVWEFPSADAKKALVGAGHTLYAKPWTREIFLQTERFLVVAARVTLFLSAFAGAPSGIRCSAGVHGRRRGPAPFGAHARHGARRGARRGGRRERSRRRVDDPPGRGRHDRRRARAAPSQAGALAPARSRGRAPKHARRLVLCVPARDARAGAPARAVPFGGQLHRRLSHAAAGSRGRVAALLAQAAAHGPRSRARERTVSPARDLQDGVRARARGAPRRGARARARRAARGRAAARGRLPGRSARADVSPRARAGARLRGRAAPLARAPRALRG